jgi:lysophospholipase L1-like esterase
LCGTLLLCELVAYTVVTYGLRGVASYLFYDRSAIASPEQIEHHFQARDPLLGWTANDAADASGARPSPAFPDPGNACVSVYGDSFAWSAGASSDATAWPNVLARMLGCRVSNYGVWGYGVDQAYLRFLHNADDEAPIVLLAVYPHDVLRNLTGNFGFLSPESGMLTLKPAFRLDAAGNLALISPLILNEAEVQDYLRDPARFHADDPFAWDGPEGGVELRFPYTWVIVKSLWNRRLWRGVRRSVTGYPESADFLQPGHHSDGFELTLAIVRQFARVATARGKRVMVLMLPEQETILYHRKSDTWTYGDLIAAIAAAGIPVLNVGEAFERRLGPSDPSSLFESTQHYNDVGYRVMAEAVEPMLIEMAGGPITAVGR